MPSRSIPYASSKTLDAVLRLTESELPSEQRRRALLDFATLSGWRPSDALVHYPGTDSVASGHLIVEHGLSSTAVLTFLRARTTFADLAFGDRVSVLSLSYNNLIDWHLFPDRHGLTQVFNRREPISGEYHQRDTGDDLWRVESFESATARRPNPNIKALDDALVETISYWKRAIAADLPDELPNQVYSAFFNAILLVRAVEDHRHFQRRLAEHQLLPRLLSGNALDVSGLIAQALAELRISPDVPLARQTIEGVAPLASLPPATLERLVNDFYANRFAPYRYDFSQISKHALSRIYEKYVALLRPHDSPQLTLFRPLPTEQRQVAHGEVYTPQYIARFFARYLKERSTPPRFRSLSTIDPACGSGLFLRNLLELQCDPLDTVDLPDSAATAFNRAVGLDIDANACAAARLSLALLRLTLTDELPISLRISQSEALGFFASRPEELGTFDAVMANPPFVRWDDLADEMRERVGEFLAPNFKGKVDLSVAFLVLAVRLLKPGGRLLFVLPHSFLLAESSRAVRRFVASECHVEALVDLSEVSVFEGLGAYVVLLICQRKHEGDATAPRDAMFAKAREMVGHALQRVLQCTEETSSSFAVYSVPQTAFQRDTWLMLPQAQQQLRERLDRYPKLTELCDLQQGLITGADAIFIRDRKDVPSGEDRCWKPLLKDRCIPRYSLPSRVEHVVFYPFIDGRWLDAGELEERFPVTWAWLEAHAEKLRKRAPVRRGNCQWWQLAWPRRPQEMFGRAKLVVPHLTIAPRFSFDIEGRVAVSHSPMALARERADETNLLAYVVAVLNSTIGFWQILSFSHKYRSGYAMLEKKTLAEVRLPHPASLRSGTLRSLLDSVMERVAGGRAGVADREIDQLVGDAFQLTGRERAEIGMES